MDRVQLRAARMSSPGFWKVAPTTPRAKRTGLVRLAGLEEPTTRDASVGPGKAISISVKRAWWERRLPRRPGWPGWSRSRGAPRSTTSPGCCSEASPQRLRRLLLPPRCRLHPLPFPPGFRQGPRRPRRQLRSRAHQVWSLRLPGWLRPCLQRRLLQSRLQRQLQPYLHRRLQPASRLHHRQLPDWAPRAITFRLSPWPLTLRPYPG